MLLLVLVLQLSLLKSDLILGLGDWLVNHSRVSLGVVFEYTTQGVHVVGRVLSILVGGDYWAWSFVSSIKGKGSALIILLVFRRAWTKERILNIFEFLLCLELSHIQIPRGLFPSDHLILFPLVFLLFDVLQKVVELFLGCNLLYLLLFSYWIQIRKDKNGDYFFQGNH